VIFAVGIPWHPTASHRFRAGKTASNETFAHIDIPDHPARSAAQLEIVVLASTFGKFQNGMIAQKIRMSKGWKGMIINIQFKIWC
jgi:hypothetical protein